MNVPATVAGGSAREPWYRGPMNTVAFDTHAAIEDLKHGGLNQSQAEAVVKVFRNATGEPVTKADLEPLATQANLRAEIADLEATLTWRIVLALGAFAALVRLL